MRQVKGQARLFDTSVTYRATRLDDTALRPYATLAVSDGRFCHMRRAFMSVIAATALAGCSTSGLPYEYDGASGYERFSVPIVIQFPDTELKAKTVSKVGETIIFETPIAFSDVMEAREDVTILTSQDDLFGIIKENQSFIGMNAGVSSLNWGAALFGMGVADMITSDGDIEKVFCTRLVVNAEALANSAEEITRFACFKDADGDGLMDEAYAPVGSSRLNSGYLPSYFMKKVSTSFPAFQLYPGDNEALSNELKLVGKTNREQRESWLGTRTDDFYKFQGTLVPTPNPRGIGGTSWDMTDFLPADGTIFANKVDWLGGIVALSRETEEDPWSIDIVLPSGDQKSDLTLVYDIGR